MIFLAYFLWNVNRSLQIILLSLLSYFSPLKFSVLKRYGPKLSPKITSNALELVKKVNMYPMCVNSEKS